MVEVAVVWSRVQAVDMKMEAVWVDEVFVGTPVLLAK